MFDQGLNTSVYMTITFILFVFSTFLWYGTTIVLMQSYYHREKIEKIQQMSVIIKEGNLLT